ncbi:hypothetical protein M8C21_014569 [Ambrosia artemisiifolia]|uniref:Uncharacterized protein n=1 Tax=Ambrosia artemisiifolia TaxID=4212 RepID=A0AAD5CEH6_AMBAR|nr:hypothetical protein M8C21_014569 [Ambrosia artemisiifolia]
MIVLYIKNRRYITRKRRGSYDAEKMAKILNDSSLNFKYSTGVLQDGREIAVKRLYVNNKFRAVDFYNETN